MPHAFVPGLRPVARCVQRAASDMGRPMQENWLTNPLGHLSIHIMIHLIMHMLVNIVNIIHMLK